MKCARKSRVSTFLAFCFSVGMTLNASSVFAAGSLAAANADLQAGKADEAASLLNQALQASPNDAEANNLLCRVEYSMQHFDQAGLEDDVARAAAQGQCVGGAEELPAEVAQQVKRGEVGAVLLAHFGRGDHSPQLSTNLRRPLKSTFAIASF